MLTGLNVSSIACEWGFYRPEHNAKGDHMELNFQVLEMQKWTTSTNRVERVYEKSGIIGVVIMFTPWVMVIKMPKMNHFFVFLPSITHEW